MTVDPRKSEFVLFDGNDVQREPIARLALRTPIHFGFHTAFYPIEAEVAD